MSSAEYTLPINAGAAENVYVFDITTTTVGTQMFLGVTNWVHGGNSLLGSDALTVANAVNTAILGLTGVTGSTQSQLNISCRTIGVGHQLVFSASNWSLWEQSVYLGVISQHQPLVLSAAYAPPPGQVLISSSASPVAAVTAAPGPAAFPVPLTGPVPTGTYQGSGYPAGMALFARSPADGVLTSTQVFAVATASRNAALTITGVATASGAVTAISPATV